MNHFSGDLATRFDTAAILRISLLLLISITPAFSALDGPSRSISSSKQFVIYSNISAQRSAAAVRAEDNKDKFLEFLREKDEWGAPIIVQFGSPPNVKHLQRFQLRIYEGDNGGNKVQLDIYDSKLLQEPEFDIQILNALVLEYMYRKTPVRAGRNFEPPPAWFVEGIAERIHTRDEGLPPSLYAKLLSNQEPPLLADFLNTQPRRLDATSLSIYRAQAAAIVTTLVDLPDGRAGLRAYLSVPRRASSTLDELLSTFPSLGGNRNTLSRKWVLTMARASALDRVNLMTDRETARELDTILTVKALPDPKHPEVAAMSGPYALPTIARSQNGRFILAQLENNLLRLLLRTHPLYKPLVEEYLSITSELFRKPKSRVDQRIAAAEEIRTNLSQKTSEIRDYMDWIETTKIQTQSSDLSRAMEDIKDLEQAPARTDAISRHLDMISDRGW